MIIALHIVLLCFDWSGGPLGTGDYWTRQLSPLPLLKELRVLFCRNGFLFSHAYRLLVTFAAASNIRRHGSRVGSDG